VKNNVTNIDGVFAGGDCVNGGKEVVDAVQAGKDGAKAILEFLQVVAPHKQKDTEPHTVLL
jgi:glutamate synthase (NADPH/NADH) small chain